MLGECRRMCISMSLRLAWSTGWVPGQPRLHGNPVSKIEHTHTHPQTNSSSWAEFCLGNPPLSEVTLFVINTSWKQTYFCWLHLEAVWKYILGTTPCYGKTVSWRFPISTQNSPYIGSFMDYIMISYPFYLLNSVYVYSDFHSRYCR